MTKLPKGWKLEKIGNLCDVGRGSSPRPIADSKYFEDGTIPWIKIADATKSGKYLYETKEHVNEFGASFSRLMPKGSLIVAASGTLGYTQLLGVDGCVHDGWLYLTNYNGVEKDFLYYFFHAQKEFFFNSAYGAAIQNINTMIMREMEIALPPIPVQRRIADILSVYDDLIENNTHRIKILEGMAQSIYHEWFGKVNKESLPKGWEMVTVEDLYKTASGGTPSRKHDEYFGGEINWVKTQELRDCFIFKTDEQITDEGLKNSSTKIFPKGTVLIALYGATIGKLGILTLPASTNQACCALLPTNDLFGRAFAYMYLLANRQKIIALSGGAAQQNISQVIVKQLEILKPSTDIMIKFNKVAEPILDMICVLQAKNNNLRQTRDLLLPRLVSGEIPVHE